MADAHTAHITGETMGCEDGTIYARIDVNGKDYYVKVGRPRSTGDHALAASVSAPGALKRKRPGDERQDVTLRDVLDEGIGALSTMSDNLQEMSETTGPVDLTGELRRLDSIRTVLKRGLEQGVNYEELIERLRELQGGVSARAKPADQ
jgi:hypothetical protein